VSFYRRETWSLGLRQHHRLTLKTLGLLYVAQRDSNEATRWTIRGSNPSTFTILYLNQIIQIDSGVQPGSYSMGIGGSFLRALSVCGEVAGPQPNIQVKYYSHAPPPTACLHGVNKDLFLLLYIRWTQTNTYKHSVSRSEETVTVRKTNMWIPCTQSNAVNCKIYCKNIRNK
jgi:hypothetical protein